MPERTQRVILVRHSLEPEALIALGARLCYAGGDVDKLLQLVSEKDQQAFLEKVMGMGHESVLEHASFTFLAEGVSRVLLAQLTRHRIASFSVQSQRYVSYENGFGYIVPPAIHALGEGAAQEYAAQMAQMQAWY
ncbi:MAG: FAD-dependent thymidylate synthase, partial [Clostridia bacterium]